MYYGNILIYNIKNDIFIFLNERVNSSCSLSLSFLYQTNDKQRYYELLNIFSHKHNFSI